MAVAPWERALKSTVLIYQSVERLLPPALARSGPPIPVTPFEVIEIYPPPTSYMKSYRPTVASTVSTLMTGLAA